MERRNAIEIAGLRKVFKDEQASPNTSWAEAIGDRIKALFKPAKRKVALDGVDLDICPGEFFGIIGSNGAGKTTLLKLLACLLYPDGGTATVNGYDIRRERRDVRRSIIVVKAQGWLGTLWQLTGRQNLLFQARMCGIPSEEAERRADFALRYLDVADKANEYSWNWSAGEQQKFSLMMSFVARTPVVLLDEPTAHLDPYVAGLVRKFIKEALNTNNRQTVVMSTHYLEEADALCDRVAILHEGRVAACDTPEALKRRYVPEEVLEVRVENYAPDLADSIKTRCGATEILEHFEDPVVGRARLRVQWTESSAPIRPLLDALRVCSVEVKATRTVRPTLDDVYFRVTKEKLR